jgi:hypothetical protein
MNRYLRVPVDIWHRVQRKYTPVFRNQSGQLAGLFVFIVVIVIIGLYYILLSPLMYQFTEIQNDMIDGGMVASQEKLQTMVLLQAAWKFVPIICMLFIFMWLIMNALRENSGSI